MQCFALVIGGSASVSMLTWEGFDLPFWWNNFLFAGLHDPRVGYWEPAKFVAKLRAQKTDNNLLLFKCNMQTGKTP
jgi:Prolyl oligopeptidase family